MLEWVHEGDSKEKKTGWYRRLRSWLEDISTALKGVRRCPLGKSTVVEGLGEPFSR